MCRLLAYSGPPILLGDLLYRPQNSIIHQSYHALERLDPVNGDGFGIGWYAPEITPQPARFVSVRPAWNNDNLRSLAGVTRSGCVFAHVRAATFGSVNETNCHPFRHRELLMMHNGQVGGFPEIRRRLRALLSDRAEAWIRGGTDSEHLFALFLDRLLERKPSGHDHGDLAIALARTVIDLRTLQSACRAGNELYLNLAVTNGRSLVAMRYHSGSEHEAPTLYYGEGSRYVCREDGVCRMEKSDPRERAVLVVSEKLTPFAEDWSLVPVGYVVAVTEDLAVSVTPLAL
jgi:predicted glutamine amidotransferase